MKKILFAILLVLSFACTSFASEAPVSVPLTGWGPSAILNMSQFYMNGNYNLLAGGVGGGVAYKWAEKGFVNEAGVYLGPQSAQVAGVTTTTVALIGYVDLYKAFGMGLGYQFWRSGCGIQKPDGGNVFFSVGYNLAQ
jgi:hypothetical protein